MQSPIADDNVKTVRFEKKYREENRVAKRTARPTDTEHRDYTVIGRSSNSKKNIIISSFVIKTDGGHLSILRSSFACGGLKEVLPPEKYTEPLCAGYSDPGGRRVRKLTTLPMTPCIGIYFKELHRAGIVSIYTYRTVFMCSVTRAAAVDIFAELPDTIT
ncbi:hypothetical protein QTP88_008496 [Uroleucon formosanum]